MPTHATGPISTAWWASVTVMLVAGTAFACLLGSYLLLWLVNGDAMWPPPGLGLPTLDWVLGAIGLQLPAHLTAWLASRARGAWSRWLVRGLLPLPLLLAAAGAGAASLAAAGIDPTVHSYGAISWAIFAWQAAHVAIALIMVGYALARTRGSHPVKIEGNPAHPGSLGATDPFLEAAVLSLHDPARSRQVRGACRAARRRPRPRRRSTRCAARGCGS